MTPDQSSTFISSLFDNLLNRAPSAKELERWTSLLIKGRSADKIYYSIIKSKEYAKRSRVKGRFPSGHYYSPVVDPDTVVDYVQNERLTRADEISGIEVPVDEMEAFWRQYKDLVESTPFEQTKNDKHRYFYSTGMFPYGDAAVLRLMIADLKPSSIVEIGSGYSTACMLDTLDEFEIEAKITCIEPNPGRLKSLLEPEDYGRVTVHETVVQKADKEIFKKLQRGDILFIDSAHVLKTGSDVHFELFHILPLLNSGVIVHVHDIRFPFEYGDKRIFEDNHSWNEIYALRAFLMYNSEFKIKFWGNCLALTRPEVVSEVLPQFIKMPGGSIWLERV